MKLYPTLCEVNRPIRWKQFADVGSVYPDGTRGDVERLRLVKGQLVGHDIGLTELTFFTAP